MTVPRRRTSLHVVIVLCIITCLDWSSRRQRRHDGRISIFADAYPMLLQVEEHDKRCFRLNVPQGDDGHVVFLPLPNEDEVNGNDLLERWYIDAVYELAKSKPEYDGLPKTIRSEQPTEVAQAVSKYLQSHPSSGRATLRVTLRAGPTEHLAEFSYPTQYFKPTVINYIKKLTRSRTRHKRDAEEDNLNGYEFCLHNDGDLQVQVVYESMLNTEKVEDSDVENAFAKDKHLSPLERSLEKSIEAAHVVLREMTYMERREQRMRQTADSINARVRWFSYLSMAVLLSVTYVQVTYLKRYFHKKKLM